MSKTLFIPVSGLLFSLCISCAYTIEINSFPEKSTVYIATGNRETKVGVTPLTMSRADVVAKTTDSLAHFVVKKPGYESVDFFIASKLNQTLKLAISLPESTQTDKDIRSITLENKQELDDFLEKIFAIQNLIIQQQNDKALPLLALLEEQYKDVAMIYVLKGNILLNQKKNPEALEQFKKAQELDKNDGYIKVMIDRLQAPAETTKSST